MRIVTLITFCLLAGQALAASEWLTLANKLVVDGEDTKVTVKKLRALPTLEQQLRKGLKGPHKMAALEVIGVLKLKQFIPTLMKLSKSDTHGFVYANLIPLIDEKTDKKVIITFAKRLKSKKTSPAAKVGILDALGRSQHRLKQVDITPLFLDPSYEVRISTMQYLSQMFAHQALPDSYLGLIPEGLKGKPYQLRLESIYAISKLPPKLKKQALRYKRYCLADGRAEVLKACRGLE